jgi:hypothetical protein
MRREGIEGRNLIQDSSKKEDGDEEESLQRRSIST